MSNYQNKPRKTRPSDGVLVVIGWIGVLVVVGGAWQFASTNNLVNPVFTGVPTEILKAFVDSVTGPTLFVDARTTLTAALVGAASASVLGISCAFVLAQSDIWRKIFDPYFTMFNGLPRVALAPLFLLWFGIGITSKIVLAASITFFAPRPPASYTTSSIASVVPRSEGSAASAARSDWVKCEGKFAWLFHWPHVTPLQRGHLATSRDVAAGFRAGPKSTL